VLGRVCALRLVPVAESVHDGKDEGVFSDLPYAPVLGKPGHTSSPMLTAVVILSIVVVVLLALLGLTASRLGRLLKMAYFLSVENRSVIAQRDAEAGFARERLSDFLDNDTAVNLALEFGYDAGCQAAHANDAVGPSKRRQNALRDAKRRFLENVPMIVAEQNH
jgi:hypothetical protein